MQIEKSKAKYIELSKNNHLSFFHQPWWLDLVAGSENWDAMVIANGTDLVAVWPYYLKRKFRFFKLNSLPPFCQFLGPQFINLPKKLPTSLGLQKDIVGVVLENLPSSDALIVHLDPEIKYYLPFYWKNAVVTPRTTYQLDLAQPLESIYAGFQSNIKSDIKKAKEKYGLEIKNDLAARIIYNVYEATFSRQNLQVPCSRILFNQILTQVRERGCGEVLTAVDSSGAIHAFCLIVYWRGTSYYLIGGANPELRNSGAQSFLLWDAIQSAKAKGLTIFDFEGSSIESIERAFRAFGGVPAVFWRVEMAISAKYRIVQLVQSLLF